MKCGRCGGPVIGDNLFCDECKCPEPDLDEDDEIEFIPCSRCDGHDACEDFGCAFELGLVPDDWS